MNKKLHVGSIMKRERKKRDFNRYKYLTRLYIVVLLLCLNVSYFLFVHLFFFVLFFTWKEAETVSFGSQSKSANL